MKKKYKLTIITILFLIMTFIIASIINDIIFLLFKEKSDNLLFFAVKVIIIFIIINLFLKYSKFGKEISKLFNRKSKK